MKFTLQELGLIDAPPEERYENLTRLAASLIGAPVSLVSIVDFERDRQFFKSEIGLVDPWATQRQTPLSHSFCQHVVRNNEKLVVDNAPDHPLVKDNLAIPNLGVMAYLGAPIYGPGEQAVGALCVVDGDPRHWTEDEIETVTRLAACVTDVITLRSALLTSERLRKEQRDFTYAISHDLLSPANTVRMIIDEVALEQDRLSEETRELIPQAMGTLQRMGHQIEDVLSYSRTLDTEASRKLVDLNTLVADILVDLRAKICEAGASIDCGSLPVIKGDEMQLRALFQNLIANALKFTTPERKPVVRIWVEGKGVGKEHCICVEDNGIGIAPENQAKIFELFRRLNLRERYDGTGIGLTLCRRVAENHNGKIDIRSDGQTGSTFIIKLDGAQ